MLCPKCNKRNECGAPVTRRVCRIVIEKLTYINDKLFFMWYNVCKEFTKKEWQQWTENTSRMN